MAKRRSRWTLSESERFWAKVEKTRGCWLWTAWLNEKGYGYFHVVREGRKRDIRAHRYAYEMLVGPIPDGHSLDHLCRVRHCVNPAHLEPVSIRDNSLRGETFQRSNLLKTHCVHGHPFDEANTIQRPPTKRNPFGRRDCRTCRNADARRYRAEKKAALAAGR